MVALYQGIRNPGNFCLWNSRNSWLWIPEYAKEIPNPTNDWNLESKFYRHKIGSQFLESGILSVESKIQDCLVLPYVGREWVEE